MKSFVLFLFLFFQGFAIDNSRAHFQSETDSVSVYYDKSKEEGIGIKLKLSYIEKSIFFGRKSNSTRLYLKSLSRKASIYRESDEYDKAFKALTNLRSEALMLNNINYQALSYKKEGKYYKEQGLMSESLSSYLKSLDLYREIENIDQVIDISKSIADIQNDIGLYSQSEIVAIQAEDFAISHKNRNNKELTWIYNALGRSFKERGHYGEALTNYKKAFLQDTSNYSRISIIQNKALIYMEKCEYVKASNLLDSLKNSVSPVKKPKIYSRVLSNFSKAQFLSNGPGPLLEKDFLKAYEIRKSLKEVRGTYSSCIHLAQYYQSTNRGKVVRYAKEALKLADKFNSYSAKLEALEYLIEFSEGQEVKYYAQKQSRVYSEFNDQRNQVSEEYASYRYNYERVEKELIRNEAKSNLRILGLIFSIIIIIVLSTSSIAYLNQKSKQKQLQERYLTESRISKKIHDELANDVFQVMSQLELQKAPDETLDQLDGIYQKTRDISKEHQPIDTNTPFPKTLSTMLSSLVPEHAKLVLRGLDNFKWETLNMQKKTELYRSLQELMTNMKRHSQATHITIAFTKVGQALKIRYSDNGVGIQTANYQKGGLQNVESRIASIKGILTFETDDISGLKAEIQIPV